MSGVCNFWMRSAGLGMLTLASHLAYADISGKVFRDFNANGVFDTGAAFNEQGQVGVTVKAFDATGTEKASTASAADGSYTLTGLNSGTPYRVQFSWAETWLMPSAAGGTSVQFVQDGATNVQFALIAPDEFSQDNPQLITPSFVVGEPTDANVANKPRLIEFGYLSGANGRRFPASDDEAVTLQPEVTDIAISSAPSSAGTLNAVSPNVAGHSRTDTVKMSEVGPLYGLAYHRQTNVLLAGAFMKRFVGFPGGASDSKLGTIYTIDRNVNPNAVTSFFTANAGVDSHDYSNSALNAPSGDTTAASQVGKAGWGDIDLSPDGSVLYAVNLFDKKIYAIPVTRNGTGLSAGTASTIAFPASAATDVCANGDWAPGGLKVTRGFVFATVTCTAETSQSASDLHFYVYKFAQDNPSVFIKVVDRGNYPRDIDWHPWLNDPYNQDHGGYNQPWLMDVEFDDLGRIYVGVRNRTGDMESSNDGSYFFEFGDTIVGLPNSDGTYDTTYTDEFVDDNSGHMENDMGALAHWFGSGTMVTPAHIGNLIQGIRTYNTSAALTSTANGTVTPLRYFGIHQSPRAISAVGDPFGKVAGLGDLEVLTQPAPIEIGNRVWLDTDKDGTQDAGENGIPNVPVQLLAGATVVATATTDSDGTYYFSSATGTNTSSKQYGLSLQPNTAYTVKFPTTVNVTGTAYTLTTASAGGDTLLDSNAASSGEVSISTTDIPMSGANNHSFDVGYVENPQTDLALSKTVTKTTVKKGETVQYVLTVSNTGAGAASAVEVKDSLPAGVSYQSHVASQGSYSDSTGIWTVGTLNNGESATLTIDVQVK